MKVTAILLVVLAGSFLLGLGDPGLWPKDEARYAQASREMRESGDWLVPTLGWEPRLNKPPLFYWIGAVSQAVFGETEFAVRLPAALAGIASAMLAFFLGRRLFGLRAGIVAAIVYATSVMPAGMGRLGHPDSLLSLFVCGAIVLFFLAWREGFRRSRPLYGAWALMSLGFLVKGPHGVLLPLLVILVFLAIRREWGLMLRLRWLLGLPLAILPVGVWAAFVSLRMSADPADAFATLDHWATESVGRFAGATSYHREAVWFFLPVVIGGFCPWILAMREIVAWLWRRRDPEPAKTLLWIWPVVVIVFFSLSPNKAAGYVMPAFLPLAVATGAALSGPRHRVLLAGTIVLAAATMIAGLCVVAPIRNREKSLRGPGMAAWQMFGAPSPGWLFNIEGKKPGLLWYTDGRTSSYDRFRSFESEVARITPSHDLLIFTDRKKIERIRRHFGRETTVVWERKGWRDVLVRVAGE